MSKCTDTLQACQNVNMYRYTISTIFFNMLYFPYFSELKIFRKLKTTDQKQPVSILKPAIAGRYMIVP